jgi:UDP-2,3-diacylglucosamine pyrophosphatase LpxH
VCAYIIVSDVHLGSEKCNQKEFCHFLEWVRGLEIKPEVIKCKDKEIKIKKPDKMILLGDILELWGPRDGDRDNVIKDCIRPFSLLQ